MRKFLLAAALAVIGLWGGAAHATCPTVNPNQFGPPFTDACPLPAAGLNVLAQGPVPAVNRTVYMAFGATNTGNACLVSSTPCGTIAAAVAEASALNMGAGTITVSVADTGPYLGGPIVFSPPKGGIPTSNLRGYPWLTFVGQNGSVIVTENPSFTECVICVNNGSTVEFVNFTFRKATGTGSGVFDVLAAGFSQVILENTVMDNATNNVTTEGMIDAEVNGQVLLTGTLGFMGATGFAAEGEDQGVLLNQASTITCTSFSMSDSFWFLNHSILDDETGSTYSGCPTTGVGVHANGNSEWKHNGSTTTPPGNTFRINSRDTVMPVPFSPALGTCTNGTLRSGSTNYEGRVSFSGSGSLCHITFGEPSGYATYFNAEPECVTSGSVSGLTLLPSTTDIEIEGSFVSGTTIDYICNPLGGG